MGEPVAWVLLDETLSADTPLSGGEWVWLTPLFGVCADELRAEILEGMDDIVLEQRLEPETYADQGYCG